MRGFRWMILAPILFLATVAQAQEVQETGDTAKLDQLTQKLKKECEDQGGKFVLESASAKHTPPPDSHMEGRLAVIARGKAGGTGYQASGVCTTTLTVDFSHPPPKP